MVLFYVCILTQSRSRGRCKGPAFNLSTRPALACALRASGAPRAGSRRASWCRDGAPPLIDRRLRLIQTPGAAGVRSHSSGPPVEGHRRRRRRRPLQRTSQQARPSRRTEPERSAGYCRTRRAGTAGRTSASPADTAAPRHCRPSAEAGFRGTQLVEPAHAALEDRAARLGGAAAAAKEMPAALPRVRRGEAARPAEHGTGVLTAGGGGRGLFAGQATISISEGGCEYLWRSVRRATRS